MPNCLAFCQSCMGTDSKSMPPGRMLRKSAVPTSAASTSGLAGAAAMRAAAFTSCSAAEANGIRPATEPLTSFR